VDEVLLELEPAIGGPHLGRHRRVRHRQDASPDPERGLQAKAHLGEPPAGADARGPGDVQREVPVAEPEPGLLAVRAQLVHRRERVALDAPAERRLLDAREVVQDGVVVGHDEEPVADAVVARVHDDVEAIADLGGQALGKLRAADPARERDDPAGHASSSSSTSPSRSMVSAS
jgi:hypothetical protein